ncbi:MAG TPA: ABC transporter permease [Candidatus Saccharimonadales bacterium]|nr:ABC transporter permease [Candidatus Saccharimonadales bacterium]
MKNTFKATSSLWGPSAWEQIAQDLRFGLRMLRKNPGFSLTAILTLALGIGANTAIFTVTSAVLLKPLPYRDSNRLVVIEPRRKDSPAGSSGSFSLGRYEQVRDRSRSFSGITVGASDTLNLTGRGEPVQAQVARVTPNALAVLGLQPQLGQTFTEQDGRPEGRPVIMIGDSLWRSRFGADRNIIGQSVNLDSAPYTIIGVLPPDAQFPTIAQAEIWTPRYFELTLIPAARLRIGTGYLTAVARLAPESSLQSAATEMTELGRNYRLENPAAPDVGPDVFMAVTKLQDLIVSDFRQKLLILSGAAGMVLLIACVNVAGLLLSRALARKKEIAVRAALGAGRAAVVRQLLTESILLALIAGALGLGLSWSATRSLATWGAANLPRGAHIGADTSVLAFTLVISLFTGIIFGIIPALQLSRTDINRTLREEGRGSSSGHVRGYLKDLLVASQVMLVLPLLIGSGLLARSFLHLLSVDPGFDPGNVLTMSIALPTVKYSNAQKQIAFFDELLRRLSVLPGVTSAAVTAAQPLSEIRITPVLPEGQPEVALAQRPFIVVEAVSPAFLKTMGIPLRAGRHFSEADNAQVPRVLIINDSMARRFWPHERAVGKHITVGLTQPAEIVGVSADAHNNGLAQPPDAQIYLPFPQLPWGRMNLVVRTATNPSVITGAVRAQVAAIDPDQPVTRVQTLNELMDGSRTQPRLTMLLVGIFSAAALVLVVVGIYGMLAYSVAQRRQELGIRMALGAKKADILRLVVGDGMKLTLLGIAAGMMVSLLLAPVVSNQLFNVETRDLAIFSLTPLVLLLVALVASYLPARRATQVDPTEALRNL